MANLLDAGTYRARSISAALGTTNGGKPQVAVKFSLLDFPGESITWFGYFTESTENSTLRALRTAGWTGEDLSDLAELQNPEGPEVWLVIEHETYENKTRAKVRWVNSAGGLAMKNAMEGDAAKTFAARMKDKVRAFDAVAKATGGKPAPKPAPRTSGTDLEDVPQEHLDQRAREETGGKFDDIPF